MHPRAGFASRGLVACCCPAEGHRKHATPHQILHPRCLLCGVPIRLTVSLRRCERMGAHLRLRFKAAELGLSLLGAETILDGVRAAEVIDIGHELAAVTLDVLDKPKTLAPEGF